ncbi:MAG: cytochrome c [Porticoccaceae bacterium]
MRDKAAKQLLMAALLPFALLALPAQAQESGQWGSGKNLYEKVCGQCHDPQVGVGTAIAGRGLPEAYVKFIVRNGFNAMPAFPASFIDDESIAQVTEYLASLPAAAGQP